jgi:hypothetical protein
MSKTYNNRERADRYQGNRSYIHQPGSVEWWRGAFALAALVTGVWFIWHFGFSGEAKSSGFYSSRGPLNYKHAAWDMKCDACHRPADKSEHKEFWDVNGRWTELDCRHCHMGPPHHIYQRSADKEFDETCRSCHHDHSGREFSLVRISDNHCTRCHSELAQHPYRGAQLTKSEKGSEEYKPRYNGTITGFGKENGHPEFSALAQPYDRSIKFSHHLHMAPGIFVNKNAANPDDLWTLKKVKELDEKNGTNYAAWYKQYTPAGNNTDEDDKVANPDMIQLNCQACHQLDSGRRSREDWNGTENLTPEAPKESLLPPRAEGAYYLPVNFEKHCQACHPIGVNIKSREGIEFEIKLPHRKKLEDFNETLRDRVVRVFLLDKEKRAEPKLPPRFDRPLAPLDPKGKEAVDALFEEAKKQLNRSIDDVTNRANLAVKTSGSTCQKCHFVTERKENNTVEYDVKPGNTPAIWFEHSKFSHVGHRAMQCSECHQNMGQVPQYKADGSLIWNDPEKWNSTPQNKPDPIGIVGIVECQKCHSPARVENGIAIGGVRHDCTDCHRYHNAEYPLQGMGALNRDPHPDPTKRMKGNTLMEGLPPAKKQ